MRALSSCGLLLAVLAFAFVGATSATAVTATGVVVTYDIPYGKDASQRLDAYRPAAGGAGHPMVILVHGGNWTGGSKRDPNIVSVANTFVAAGMVVFSVDYRLATATVSGVPMQVQDVKKAGWWVLTNASTYGADPLRLGLFGASSGASLAAEAAEEMNVTRAHSIKVATTMSATMDFTKIVPPGTIGKAPISDFLGCDGTPCQLSVEQAASPQYHVAASCPAFHVLHSKDENIPVAQAQTFVNSLNALNCKTQLTIVPGTLHGMAYWPTVSSVVTSYFVAQL